MSTFLLAAAATLVFCAPGYPGAAGDAQPLVDQFATAGAASAGWTAGTLAAVYDPTEEGGVRKIGGADAALAFVPYAFFIQHGKELRLAPLAQADVAGVGVEERWTLVAKAGTAAQASDLAGYTLLSTAGYAPDFVRHSALGAFPLPPDVKIEATGQILGVLRRIAAGEHVVALLDQTQAAALPTLPFFAQLKSVTQSAPLPVALIAVVGSRLPAPRAKSLQAGLLKMGGTPADAETLAQLKLHGFVLPRLPATANPP